MNENAFLRATMGAAAGLVGTFAIRGLLSAGQKYAPSTVPPIRQDPGEFMVHQAERALPEKTRRAIPRQAEKAAAQSMAVGYGMLFGALYALLRSRRHKSSLLDGTLLGLAVWAAGYLGWLPATGLMPPVWKHRASQVIAPPVEHAVYGLATVAALDGLEKII